MEYEYLSPLTNTRCRHLMSKGLFLNHDVEPGEEVAGDGNFWCGQNQTIFGPDDQLCDGEHCCDPSRGCFEA